MTVPQRTVGVRCGQMVEKGHIGYPCSLPQGHEENWGEPHYAVEVDASVRAWRRWNEEVEETPYLNDRIQEVQLPATPPDPAIKPERVVPFVPSHLLEDTDQDQEIAQYLDDNQCNAMQDEYLCCFQKGHTGDHSFDSGLTVRERRWASVLNFQNLGTNTIVGDHQQSQLTAVLDLADSEQRLLQAEVEALRKLLNQSRSGRSRWLV